MPLKTRGLSALEKAERRLASMKSIEESLDLGYGLTVEAYAQEIETARDVLEAHNTLLSAVEASRQRLDQIDKDLSAFSSRMLTGVATRYGRTSIEYIKAGGTIPARRSASSAPAATAKETPAAPAR